MERAIDRARPFLREHAKFMAGPGLEHTMIRLARGTPKAHMIEQLTRFAREVMLAFRT